MKKSHSSSQVQITGSRLIVGFNEYRWHDIIRVDKESRGIVSMKFIFSALFFLAGILMVYVNHWGIGAGLVLVAILLIMAKVKNDEVVVIYYRNGDLRERLVINNNNGHGTLYEAIRKMHAERG